MVSRKRMEKAKELYESSTPPDDVTSITSDNLKDSWKQLDAGKITFLTAGLLVAVNFSAELPHKVFGIPGTKLVLVLTVSSAISYLLGAWLLSAVWRRFDIFFSKSKHMTFRRWELVISSLFGAKNDSERNVVFMSFWLDFCNALIHFFRNLSNLLLISALVAYLYFVLVQ